MEEAFDTPLDISQASELSSRIVNRFRIRILAIVFLAALILLVIQSFRWSGESGARRAHAKFLERLEDKKWGKCHRMIATDYSDRWDFNRDDVSLALRDVAGEFIISLQINWSEGSITENDSRHTVAGRIQIDGRGSPAVPIIVREFKEFSAQPFRFEWRKSGFLPWTWKLVSIDHPSVEVPSGYKPGRLRDISTPF